MNWTNQDMEKYLKKKSKPISLFPTDNEPDFKLYNELVDLVKSNNAVFIQINVPSLKNSKQIFSIPTGKSLCCDAVYTKKPDIMVEGKKKRQYKCSQCGLTTFKLGTRPILTASETHKRYKENSYSNYIKNAKQFINMAQGLKLPYMIGMYFIRDSKRGWDYDNAISTVLDLIKDNWIKEDTADIVKPIPLGYHVDKVATGVIMVIIKSADYKFNIHSDIEDPSDEFLNTI